LTLYILLTSLETGSLLSDFASQFIHDYKVQNGVKLDLNGYKFEVPQLTL